jgi:hypothetical protein
MLFSKQKSLAVKLLMLPHKAICAEQPCREIDAGRKQNHISCLVDTSLISK